MIKKLSIAAAVFVVLVLVAVLLFRQVAGPSDAATLVPADTVFFASLTDLPRSVIRWQGTSLAKIGSEPEVKAFLEKPLSQLLSKPGSGETGNLLAPTLSCGDRDHHPQCGCAGGFSILGQPQGF